MKRTKWIVSIFLLGVLMTGCYWTVDGNSIEVVSVGIPRSLLEKGGPIYYAYFEFTDLHSNETYSDSVAMPAFEPLKKGVLVMKLPPGEYDMRMEMIREDLTTSDYTGTATGVEVLPQVLVTVEVFLE